ncbi:uncharacterized protein LOC143050996 isoform X2 [Mytilus galloprovincialis]|uniref:uncharacterized protein LOC143050996 isoform X2 n=1 Tax=Mytilus galloprovincialis TaxID=29158 RepID=UPI003F7BD0DB
MKAAKHFNMENILILILFAFGILYGQATSSCPFSDPQCHPLCIEYKGECKYCRCKVISAPSSGGGSSSRDKYGGNGSGSSDRYGGSGSGLSAKWNSNYGLRDNSNSFGGGHTENSGSNSGGNTENTKVIIIHEKDTQTQQLSALPGLPMGGNMGGHMASHMSFNMPHGPMAVQNPFSHHTSSYGRGHSMNVPLKSPGIPKYCISVDKMEFEDCSCTVVDEGGCQTCPCYSASRFWIAVRPKESQDKPKPKHNECLGTTMCMMSCKGGYHLGETGSDGCQSCTCLKREQKQTEKTHKNEEKTCLKLYECIIKCSERKLGFTVGEETSDGCRSCKCQEGKSSGSGGKTNNGGGGSMMEMFGNTNGGNNVLKSPDKASNGSKAKCNPPMVMCTNDGNNLMQTMSGGSGSSAGSGGSSGSGNGSGSGSGPFNPMGGGSGSGGGMKNPFGSSSGGAGSGTGMKSPFGSSSGGAGSGAGMKSPFSKGGPGAGPGGAPGMGGMGPHGPSNPGFPSQKKVEQTSYNKNCFGPSCSAKDGGLVEGTLENDLIMGIFRK